MRACWLCWTGCLWRWNSPTVTTGLASFAVGFGGGGPHRLVEVVLDHKPFLADDAPQRGRCGPALRLKHAAVVGELQRVVFAGSQLRAGDESGGARCWYGRCRRQQDSVADVVASTCSPGDAAWSTNTQSEPATARSSATTDASKATPSSSRICTSAVGSSGTAGSTRSSWTRRGHRLATYELSGGTGAGVAAIRGSRRWWHCGSTGRRFGRSGA